MTSSGIIDTSAALDPDYPSFDYGEPVWFGDYVAWPILWYDYDNFNFKPSVDVIVASAKSDAPAFAHFFDRDTSRQPPMQRKLVRINAGTSEPVLGIPKSAVFSTLNYRLDSELYVLMSEGSGDKSDAQSSLYRVSDEKAELSLTTVGDIWAIGRIR